MSKGLFADRKLALGFAGVTVAFAIVAALSAGVFVPAVEQQASQDEIVEDAPRTAARSTQSAPPAPTWSDQGSFSDDWNASSVASANGNANWGSSNASSNEDEIDFGDYQPDRRGGSPTGQQRRPRSGQSRIASGAAAGAPSIAPPSGGGGAQSGELDIIN